MRVRPVVQSSTSSREQTVGATLTDLLQSETYDCVQVAMAYVSVAGTRSLLQACSHVTGLRSEWLVGLDDLVTQPGAIELVGGLQDSVLRVAALGSRPRRFHPKVCRFSSTINQDNQLLMVGSANLTKSALADNSESVVFLECESAEEGQLFDGMWQALWAQGHAPTVQELEAYAEAYTAARPLRAQIRDLGHATGDGPSYGEILDRDTAELDPSRARICWIECGRVTAMGRELELKAEQGLFFGLNPSLVNEQVFTFHVSDGTNIPLRLKYQQNAMWRVQMNNDVPEVYAGLRPTLPDGTLGRSEYVAVFSREDAPGHFDLSFLHVNSPEFAALREQSEQLGTASRTRPGHDGRAYGWC